MLSLRQCLAAILAVGFALVSGDGLARKPRKKRSVARFDPQWQTAPSARYANMTGSVCRAELRKRKVRFEPVAKAPGVLAPVRIAEGIDGVIYRTALPREKGRTSAWEVFDCRLVLALFDFTQILKAHDIDEVRMFSAWRPPGKNWPQGKLAKRHPGGLAIDVRRLRKRIEGSEAVWLNVEKHFYGKINATTCGPKASPPTRNSPEAVELRKIICQAADQRLFTSILTPNHDRAHHNHFHFDLAPRVKWRIVR